MLRFGEYTGGFSAATDDYAGGLSGNKEAMLTFTSGFSNARTLLNFISLIHILSSALWLINSFSFMRNDKQLGNTSKPLHRPLCQVSLPKMCHVILLERVLE